jgi:hypothetical protein
MMVPIIVSRPPNPTQHGRGSISKQNKITIVVEVYIVSNNP